MSMKQENLTLKIAMIVMLVVAMFPIPFYGYYILLKLVVCGGFGYLATTAYSRGERGGWLWLLGGIAVLYNPIVRLPMEREIWTLANLATIAVLVVSVKKAKGEPRDERACRRCEDRRSFSGKGSGT